ncbi:MAG TPA: hypothetical protein VLN91_07655 [Nitrospirota bacterium]|nr:hypothetical protein [Nitrospirota bacterium]
MNDFLKLLLILSSLSLFVFISVYFAAGKETIHLIGIIVSALALGLVMNFSDRRAKTTGDGVASSKIVYGLIVGVVVAAVSVLLSSVFRVAPVIILILLIVVPFAIKGYRDSGSSNR